MLLDTSLKAAGIIMPPSHSTFQFLEQSSLPPQGLCTCCALCLESFPCPFSHSWLFFIQFSAQMSPSQRSPTLPPSPANHSIFLLERCLKLFCWFICGLAFVSVSPRWNAALRQQGPRSCSPVPRTILTHRRHSVKFTA